MKKIVRVLAVVLVVTLSLVLLCGCSSYGKLKSVCEKEGLKEITDVCNSMEAFKTENGKKAKEEFLALKENIKESIAKNTGLEIGVYYYLDEAIFENIDENSTILEFTTAKVAAALKNVVIIEFKSTDELKKQLKENEDLKAFVKNNKEEIKETAEEIEALPFVNGNCIFFTLIPTMMEKLDEA